MSPIVATSFGDDGASESLWEIRLEGERGGREGGRYERLTELSGRIDMMGQGQLRLGSGKYTSVHGIDAVYYDYGEYARSGYSSRSDYLAALSRADARGSLSILESKWRRDFSMAANPEALLGRGIKTRDDLGQVIYLRQMSTGWIREVTNRLLESTDPRHQVMGDLLRRHGRTGKRYINVLSSEGDAMLRGMR